MVFIHLRDASTKIRTRLDGVNLTDEVTNLKLKSEQSIGISAGEQRLVYLGRVLNDSQTLCSYGIAEGSTLYIFRNANAMKDTEDVPEPFEPSKLTELAAKVANNPIYQASIKQILKDKASFETLVARTPSLKKDPVALALLKDPELLTQIMETADPEKMLNEHPALGQVASYLISKVSKERTTARQLIPENHQGGAEMIDMDGIDPGLLARAEMLAANEEAMQGRPDARPQQISPMQLALALSQAGMTHQLPTTSAQMPRQPQPSASQPATQTLHHPFPPTAAAAAAAQQASITSDFFSQAIASAIASTSNPTSSAPAASHQAALQQMRDMGITNDTLSLQALAQTNGDVQAALNRIFEGGLD